MPLAMNELVFEREGHVMNGMSLAALLGAAGWLGVKVLADDDDDDGARDGVSDAVAGRSWKDGYPAGNGGHLEGRNADGTEASL
jgi:hypothetical protein